MATSTSPTKAWTRLSGSSSYELAYALTTGRDGSIYMAGFADSGTRNAFLTKYDANGNKSWTRLLGTSSSHEAYALTTGTDGSIYMAGRITGNLGSQTNSGSYDAFLTKYDAKGKISWMRLLGTSSVDVAYALTTGTDGAIYMAGYTQGNLDGQTIYDGQDRDAFLTKYDARGNKEWTQLLGTIQLGEARALTTGTDGAIYMAGRAIGIQGGTRNGSVDAFLAKYDANGNKAWTRVLGTHLYDYATALTTGTDGAIYMAGVATGNLDGQTSSGSDDAFLAKYDSNGSKVWTRLLGTRMMDQANALTTGTDGAIYMAGPAEGSLDEQNYSGGTDDAFLTKYDANGNKSWTRLLGTSSWDEAYALTTGTDGAIYIAGITTGSLDGQPYGGRGDTFLTKWIVSGDSSAHTLSILVDKGVLGSIPVLLKDLVEEITTTGTTVTSHTVTYQGTKFKYSDIDALITTVIRNGEFTEEFLKEIADQYPTVGNITYKDAVSLVGAANIDAILISVAGADGNYVG